MLTEDQMQRVSRHKMVHDMGMCTCPCFDALMAVAEGMKERDEAVRRGGLIDGLVEGVRLSAGDE